MHLLSISGQLEEQGSMDVISIRHVRVRSVLAFGFVVGAIVACLPAFMCGATGAGAVSVARRWLEGWQTIRIDLLLDTLEFNLVEILRLQEVLTRLQALDQRRMLLGLVLALGLTLGAGLLAAVITGLSGAVYNAIAGMWGGIELEVENGQAGAVQMAPQRAPRKPTLTLPRAPATAWLVLAADPNRSWPLSKPVQTLGNQLENDVVLPYPGVGAVHAEIRLEAGRFVIHDRSDGQIWVNGRPIAGRNLLKDGFQVRLGATDFVFRQRGV
jgi:hypothetical protein